jgi:hypothetical protein
MRSNWEKFVYVRQTARDRVAFYNTEALDPYPLAPSKTPAFSLKLITSRHQLADPQDAIKMSLSASEIPGTINLIYALLALKYGCFKFNMRINNNNNNNFIFNLI